MTQPLRIRPGQFLDWEEMTKSYERSFSNEQKVLEMLVYKAGIELCRRAEFETYDVFISTYLFRIWLRERISPLGILGEP